jgi:hypothetical protein
VKSAVFRRENLRECSACEIFGTSVFSLRKKASAYEKMCSGSGLSLRMESRKLRSEVWKLAESSIIATSKARHPIKILGPFTGTGE